MLERLDAAAVRHWCAAGLEGLRRHQTEINELNVYPVPDGDTGTNLVLTIGAAWQALTSEPENIVDFGRVLHCMARGATMGARGNSGVIVAEILRTSAEMLAQASSAGGRALADALHAAAKAAYAAVAVPVEGTVLTVATAAAAAARATDSDDLATVVRAAAEAATEALARTPEQLPVLARAGVVDAGGRGLVVLFDALVEVVTGVAAASAPPARLARQPRLLTVDREMGSQRYSYELQYLLDAPNEAVEELKRNLALMGDSLVVIGAGTVVDAGPVAGHDAAPVPTWNVHVHVNDVGAAFEATVAAGRPHRISVTRFADQGGYPSATGLEATVRGPSGLVAAGMDAAGMDAVGMDAAGMAAGTDARGVDEDARALVVVVPGPGLSEVFAAEGAVVVDGGPTSSPSTEEVFTAIRATNAGEVVLLPNDPNVHAVVAAAAERARAEGIGVGVVPTRSPLQGLAAIAVRDPGRRFHDDVIAMAEAAGACRYAEVTVASRTALTVAGRCEPGDILALIEGEVNVIGHDLRETSQTLLDRLLAGGGEMVTLVLGADAPADLAQLLTRHLRERWPFVEVQHYQGDQPHYPLLVGVE